MSNLLFCYIAELNFTVSYFSFTMFARTKRVKPIDVAKECILRGGEDPDGTTVHSSVMLQVGICSHIWCYKSVTTYMVEINKIT